MLAYGEIIWHVVSQPGLWQGGLYCLGPGVIRPDFLTHVTGDVVC